MHKFVSIFKNKEIVGRIFFTIMILFVIRIGAAITVPGVRVEEQLAQAMNSGNAIALMDLMGGGALSNFSVFALGVSPYITAQRYGRGAGGSGQGQYQAHSERTDGGGCPT